MTGRRLRPQIIVYMHFAENMFIPSLPRRHSHHMASSSYLCNYGLAQGTCNFQLLSQMEDYDGWHTTSTYVCSTFSAGSNSISIVHANSETWEKSKNSYMIECFLQKYFQNLKPTRKNETHVRAKDLQKRLLHMNQLILRINTATGSTTSRYMYSMIFTWSDNSRNHPNPSWIQHFIP